MTGYCITPETLSTVAAKFQVMQGRTAGPAIFIQISGLTAQNIRYFP
jgi:hypothetical protein